MAFAILFAYICKNLVIMKRILSLSLAILALSGASAQIAPAVYPGTPFNRFSPDGKYGVADSGAHDPMVILDFENNKTYPYVEEYGGGSGNYISNTGIVVGYDFLGERACYWQNGNWQKLNVPLGTVLSYANGITPDGSRIVGDLSPRGYAGDYEGLMVAPCYWDLQSDGTYGDPVMLPHPSLDYTGRPPQYVTCVRVSDDGKIIAGQVKDFRGMVCQPIIFTQDDKGEWSYTMLLEDLFYPEDIKLPPYPGDGPMPQQFMTEDELNAYNLAVRQWELTGNDDYDTYPAVEDFMTYEEIQAYDQASLKWQADYAAYDEVLYKLESSVPNFTYNNVLLSSDGKTYASTHAIQYSDDLNGLFFREYIPYLIDIPTETYQKFPSEEGINIMLSSLCDDGTLLGQVNNTDYGIFNGYILPAGETEFTTLYDFMKTADPSVAEWMEKNMTHTYLALNQETGQFYYDTTLATGIPFATPDMSLIGFAQSNFWDEVLDEFYYGYLISLKPYAGVEEIVAQPVDGVYSVYNLQGVKVLETKDASALDALPKGLYIINGKKILL